MTVPHITVNLPQPTIVATLFTAAGASTLLAVLHVIIAVQNDWPPQLMTLHAAATLGLWIAGCRVQDRRRAAAASETTMAAAASGPSHHRLDDLTVTIDPLDQLELDLLEQRLRETD